jgi:hypothetical protein
MAGGTKPKHGSKRENNAQDGAHKGGGVKHPEARRPHARQQDAAARH